MQASRKDTLFYPSPVGLVRPDPTNPKTVQRPEEPFTMTGRNATRVADGGFVPGLRTDKPVAAACGAAQDAAVLDVFWPLLHRSGIARSLPSAAQGEQGSAPSGGRNAHP